jgi:hypothetical protein
METMYKYVLLKGASFYLRPVEQSKTYDDGPTFKPVISYLPGAVHAKTH